MIQNAEVKGKIQGYSDVGGQFGLLCANIDQIVKRVRELQYLFIALRKLGFLVQGGYMFCFVLFFEYEKTA